MATRLLRDGILSSEQVCSLAWDEEIFYRRLMSVADDHGRFHSTPTLLRSACYPLQIDKVSDSDINRWIAACVSARLLWVYTAADGKRYLQILKFGQQQRSKSKFPDPVGEYEPPIATDNSCEQPQATVHLVGDVFVCEDVVEGGSSSPASPANPAPAGFDEFWEAFPNLGRKTGKGKAMELWRRNGLSRHTAEIVAHVRAMATAEQWRTGFQPLPATYLSQGRWQDPIPRAGPKNEARAFFEDTLNGSHGERDGSRDEAIGWRDATALRRRIPS